MSVRYKFVSFRMTIRAPRKQGPVDACHEREGYTITRNGDDVAVHHAEFGDEVMLVPWSNVAYAWADGGELGDDAEELPRRGPGRPRKDAA